MCDKETNKVKKDALVYASQNDFLVLSRAFSLPEIDYTDISQRENLAAAIKRWPLLAELRNNREQD